MFRNHAKLFQDPKIDYPIYDASLNFADYIKKCKSIIANTRLDLKQQGEMIIEANSPFEFRPSSVHKKTAGILLIHGLLDSPFIMRDIGRYLQAQGLWVRSILLPGHGTVPGALLNVDYHDWLQAVNYGVNSFAGDVDRVFLAGFSTGASLALHHAARHQSIAGVVMLSPAIQINSRFAFISTWLSHFGNWWNRAHWFHIADEIDYTKYRSITFNAIQQVFRLGQEINQLGQPQWANCPFFIALSVEDKIISAKSAIDFFQRNANAESRMLLYTKQPDYSAKNPFVKNNISVRNAVYPELGILSFSHITLPIAPQNPHYGMRGDYFYASHVNKNKFTYGAFNKIDLWLYQQLFNCGLVKQQYRRLTFNPDFDFMAQEINQFVQTS